MRPLIPLALFAATVVRAQQAAPPQFGTVGVRGAIDGGGYSAGVAERAQSRLVRDLESVAGRLPCPHSAEQNSFAKAVALYRQSQTDQARQMIAKSLVTYPHSALLLIGRGALLYNDGYGPEALASFQAAAKFDAKSGDPFLFIARLAAIPALVDPATLAGEADRDAQAKAAYATSLLTAGQEQRAEAAFRQALASDPKLAEAHAQLAALEARHGNEAEAIKQYRAALELDPNLTEVHYRLAQLYLRTGQKEAGETELAEQQRQRRQPTATTSRSIDCAGK